MKISCSRVVLVLLSPLLLEIGTAEATPLIYRVTTVADGKLGAVTFSNAIVRVSIYSDSRAVTAQQVLGSTVYENHAGTAVVTVTEAGRKSMTAHVRAGQLFVRYDITNGIVSIGSIAVGSFYPFVIGCANYPTCSKGNADLSGSDGISSDIPAVLAGLSIKPQLASQESPATVALPAVLTSATVLHGFVTDCVAYDAQFNCSGPPATPIPTVEGGQFYVVDRDGGSATAQFVVLPNAEGGD